MATTRRPPLASVLLTRELSWLEFNRRVLELAADDATPLLERLKFCAIFANNLDEFFMVRVAGLADHVAQGTTPSDGTSAAGTLDQIAATVRELEATLADVLHQRILPALRSEGIAILRLDECTPEERSRLSDAFQREIFPVLTPLAVGPGRPFPYISNLSLSLGVHVLDPVSGERRFARVKVPEVLPRFLTLTNGARYVPLEELLADNIGALFPGMVIEEHACFRVTRDADFEISEGADDLLEAVEQQLVRRRFGDVVRLEVEDGMGELMLSTLVDALDVDRGQVYRVPKPLDLADLMPLSSIDRPELRFRPWTPQTHVRLRQTDTDEPVDVFAAMRRGDILVHHPYHAFSTSVERFIEQAVEDPDVLAIKHTIYRTSGDSPIVPALVRAAERGKQAVALVELKARFDEERNIRWARSLERAGVHVVHGLVGLKTHCKLALVLRREGDRVRRYVHIGTGNYHPATARLYTDLGLFTCDEEIGADVSDLFNHLTGFARPQRFRRLWVAPFEMRSKLVAEIERTAEEHRDDAPARITMMMNSLVDSTVIDALCRASQAGVRIELIVRGICCLRPGVEGLSENIHVSILGRFLEHARVYRFHSHSGRRTYLGSADVMPRNLDHRIEVITPVVDGYLSEEIDAILELKLRDDTGLWDLGSDSVWHRRRPEEGRLPTSSQEILMSRALGTDDDADARAARREAAARRRRRTAAEA